MALARWKQLNRVTVWQSLSQTDNVPPCTFYSRCLLLKKYEPEKWQALSKMEAHNEIRRARGDIWPINDKNVVQRMKKWKLDYDDEEIHTVCGILEVIWNLFRLYYSCDVVMKLKVNIDSRGLDKSVSNYGENRFKSTRNRWERCIFRNSLIFSFVETVE